VGRGPCLKIFQDETETSEEKLERVEDVCGVSHPTEMQFGRADKVNSQSDLFSSTAGSAPVLSGLCPLPPRVEGA